MRNKPNKVDPEKTLEVRGLAMQPFETESKAWQFLAKKWKDTKNRGEYTQTGLCKSVSILRRKMLIDVYLESSMFDRIEEYSIKKDYYWGYFWPICNKESNKKRYNLCKRFSKESRKKI